MKYNIEGFDQSTLIEYNLNSHDAIILRYFVDFKDSGLMTTAIINNAEYTWLDYASVSENCPIIHMNYKSDTERAKKRRVADSISRLIDCGVLLKENLDTNKGRTVFVKINGERYTSLVKYDPRKKKKTPIPKNGSPYHPSGKPL